MSIASWWPSCFVLKGPRPASKLAEKYRCSSSLALSRLGDDFQVLHQAQHVVVVPGFNHLVATARSMDIPITV